MPDTFEAVVQKLQEDEAALGRLYELFGQTFPQDAELWARLAEDEYRHAAAERCRGGELTRPTALALARDLENSLLEGKLLATLSSGAARVASLQKALVESTKEHRQRIIDALERVRRGG